MVLPAILRLEKPGERERERESARAYNMKYKTYIYNREGTVRNLRRDLPQLARAAEPE